MEIKRKQLIDMWISFFEEKKHKSVGSASVIPENDPSVLFTTAGMHPLVPYLLGTPHPMGKRICNVQKCIRTGDIDEVGDNCHLTFFEMLGNWSLGDYFKAEKVFWSYEFLTKKIGLKLDQLAVTCFAGDKKSPADAECAKLWEEAGMPKDKIFFLSDNWWEINRGPCGPDSEMFLDTGKEKCCEDCNPSCNCGKYIELGNDVYMQYNKVSDTEYLPAIQKNVDTGYGLERNLAALNKISSVYLTECFADAMKKIEDLSGKRYNDNDDEYTRQFRIVADHIRTATAILGDDVEVLPSNKDAGYVLRRLIRTAIKNARKLDIPFGKISDLADIFVEFFKESYPEFERNKNRIITEINKEEEKFEKTLVSGEREFEKIVTGLNRKKEFLLKSGADVSDCDIINGKTAFRLFDTFGFPIEMTVELAKENNLKVDMEGFKEADAKHKELARSLSAGKFKGGLADNNQQTVHLHTAAHLLLASLQKMFGDNVVQKGSNITSERLRFDFNFDRRLTDEEVSTLEKMINEVIEKDIEVVCENMTLENARNSGAKGIFDNKYGDNVFVYTIGDFSKEICGGPHAKKTSDLGKFKITKQESPGSGNRRIKAILTI